MRTKIDRLSKIFVEKSIPSDILPRYQWQIQRAKGAGVRSAWIREVLESM